MPRLILILVLIATGVVCSFSQTQKSSGKTPKQSATVSKPGNAASQLKAPPADNSIPTEANLKIAFIGDVGVGAGQRAVLNLIKSENVQAMLHQGDFDYHNNPIGFWTPFELIFHSINLFRAGIRYRRWSSTREETWPPSVATILRCFPQHPDFQRELALRSFTINSFTDEQMNALRHDDVTCQGEAVVVADLAKHLN